MSFRKLHFQRTGLLLLVFFWCIKALPLIGQTIDRPANCGAAACSIERAEFLQKLYAKSDLPLDSIRIFKVQAHILQNPEIATHPKAEQIRTAFDHLNENFIGSGLYFLLNPDVSNMEAHYYLHELRNDSRIEDQVTQPIEHAGMINVFFIPSSTALKGYTPVLQQGFENYDQFQLNKIFIASSAIEQQATLAHEFGHFFGLQHTFGHSNLEASTDELPDGSNCATTGDFICDTPADPSGLIDCCTCSYLGLARETGLDYKPLVNNFMSYYKWCCRSSFTPGQLMAMRKAALYYRDYLK